MKANTTSFDTNSLVVGGLGILAVLTGKSIPLLAGDRAAFFALLIIGFAMCAQGPLRNIQAEQWLQPMNILASLLGGLALLLALIVLFGLDLPLVSDDGVAFSLLAIIICSKVVLAAVHHGLMDRVMG
jgi:hypothetical protein